MSLIEAIKGARILEAIENYKLVSLNHEDIKIIVNEDGRHVIYSERSFWEDVLVNPGYYWNKSFNLYDFVVSDWLARVPGLYWQSSSAELRKHSQKEIALQSRDWIELQPSGKSKKVLGGIGTLLLPPDESGKRLISVTSNHNASLGIPVLVFPEVYDALILEQGDLVDLNDLKWQPMSLNWAQKFSSTKGIPRGYFVLDSIKKVKVRQKFIPVIYQPFSIMEYERADAVLYDFVFMSIDSEAREQYSNVERFFDYYRLKDDRRGRYLLNCNLVQPYFECRYMSPADFSDPSERAHLSLVRNRIVKHGFGEGVLDDLINIVPKFYETMASIRRLATAIGVNPTVLSEGRVVDMSAQLINYCLDNNLIELLIDRIVFEYPKSFAK
ncbi:hypothetical protein [Rufibacter latericius]|uniref:Uncharacterized protein n=1 Tax=Rufibacter latericius TaxID=2487040 RepID=A0A3M9MFE6_9BACT|nr:hypothetical protein [Rufibacter latericius]RNI23368.1 hypothetical protein EFB08_17625 [Rufibacter latericius]